MAPLHVILQLLMLLPGPEAAALRAVSGEVYIRANVNDLDLRQAVEQKGASIPKEVEDVPWSTCHATRKHHSAGLGLRPRRAVQPVVVPVADPVLGLLLGFRGFSALDELAQAKLLCLIYKGIGRQTTKQAEETTKLTVAQEATHNTHKHTQTHTHTHTYTYTLPSSFQDPESGFRIPESGFRNPEFGLSPKQKIKNCSLSDRPPRVA